MKICIEDTSPSVNCDGIVELLTTILNNQTTIMALIDDLKAKQVELETKIDGLQTSLDTEQAQIAALLETNAQVVTDLNTQIATLQAQIAAGATPEQLQEVINGFTAISEKLTTTQSDLEGTVGDAPQP